MCREKRMGVFGLGLILIGFALQSVQYWAGAARCEWFVRD